MRPELMTVPVIRRVLLPERVLPMPVLISPAVFLLLCVTLPVKKFKMRPKVVPKTLHLDFLESLGLLRTVRLPVTMMITLPADALLLIATRPKALPASLISALRSPRFVIPVLAMMNLSTAVTPGPTTFDFP